MGDSYLFTNKQITQIYLYLHIKSNFTQMFKSLNGIEELKYGNVNRESLSYLREENVFTRLFDDYSKNPYPNVDRSVKEIENLMDLQNRAMNDSRWEKIKGFNEMCDEGIEMVFKKKLEQMGVEYKDKYLFNIQEKLGGLVMRLKNFYNRPRPYQIAYYTNQNDFHAFNTVSGNSPAYPSGHSCQSWFLCRVIAFHNPEKEKDIMKLGKKIAKTREIMGVHYKSDTIFGRYIANSLCESKVIKDIYFNPKK